VESHQHHRQLTLRIRELADALTDEAHAFDIAAAGQADSSRTAQILEPSADWLERASQAMLLGIASLREARERMSAEGE